MEGMGRERNFEVAVEGDPPRLDLFLKRKLSSYTRSQIHRWVEQGYVKVNQRLAQKAGQKLHKGDRIEVALPLVDRGVRPEPLPFDLLYDDDSIAVIDKPALVVVHPGAGHSGRTMVHGLLYRFPSIARVGNEKRPGIVHRLDKGTSGVMVIAKTPEAYLSLVGQFARRAVDKEYRAIVLGEVPLDSGWVERAIGRDPYHRKQMSTHSRRGKEAVTEYCVIQRYPYATDLRVKIYSGRTHQIRVHLQSIGYPVLGDTVYGGIPSRKSPLYQLAKGLGRPALHASKLGFVHPATQKRVTFEAPLPNDMQQLMQRLSRSLSEYQEPLGSYPLPLGRRERVRGIDR